MKTKNDCTNGIPTNCIRQKKKNTDDKILVKNVTTGSQNYRLSLYV